VSDYAESMKDVPDMLKELKLDEGTPQAEVLLLTCIDFRFFDEVNNHIIQANLVGKFDHIVVAGAELGPVIDFPPKPKLHWQQFFLDHLQLASDLHAIKKVLVLGHRDCGAYKKFLNFPNDVDSVVEEKAHSEQAERLRLLIQKHHPNLLFEAHLLDDTSIA
jgi:carbonic anhydrase